MKTSKYCRWYIEPIGDPANKAVGKMLAASGEVAQGEAPLVKCNDGSERRMWEVRNFTDIKTFVNSNHEGRIYRQLSGGDSLPHKWTPPRNRTSVKGKIKTGTDLLNSLKSKK